MPFYSIVDNFYICHDSADYTSIFAKNLTNVKDALIRIAKDMENHCPYSCSYDRGTFVFICICEIFSRYLHYCNNRYKGQAGTLNSIMKEWNEQGYTDINRESANCQSVDIKGTAFIFKYTRGILQLGINGIVFSRLTINIEHTIQLCKTFAQETEELKNIIEKLYYKKQKDMMAYKIARKHIEAIVDELFKAAELAYKITYFNEEHLCIVIKSGIGADYHFSLNNISPEEVQKEIREIIEIVCTFVKTMKQKSVNIYYTTEFWDSEVYSYEGITGITNNML